MAGYRLQQIVGNSRINAQNQKLAGFAALNDAERLSLFKNLDEAEIENSAPDFISILMSEPDSNVAALMIDRFGCFLDDWQLCQLAAFVADRRYSVRLAALGVLMTNAPVFLTNYLPELLRSDDAGVRALAVRSLFVLDEAAAVEHLEAMLLGKEPEDRDMAIQSCFQLPFDKIKRSMMKVLASETDAVRLKKAGLLFITNPDTDSPFRLWAMLESATGRRADYIKEILQGAMQALKTSGVLGENFALFQERLQKHINSRKCLILCRQIFDHYLEIGDASDPGFDEQLLAYLENPRFKEIFLVEFEKNTDAAIKNRISDLLTSSSAPVSKTDFAFDAETFAGLSENDKHRAFARWPAEKLSEFNQVFTGIVSSVESGLESLQASGFRAAARLNIADFVDRAIDGLRSKKQLLTSACMEYLAVFSADALLPYLAAFLQSQTRSVRIQAIRILQQFDSEQVVGHLRLSLRSKVLGQAESALAACFFIDFSLTRDLVTEFMATNPAQNLFDNCLYLFETNPGPLSIPLLLNLEKNLPADRARQVKEVRERCQKLMIELRLWEPAKVENHVAAAMVEAEKAQNSRARPAAAYSRSSVSRNKPVAQPELKRNMLLSKAGRLFKGFCAVLLFFGGYQLSSPDTPDEKRPPDLKQEVQQEPQPEVLVSVPQGIEIYIEGRIASDSGRDWLTIEAPGMEPFRCQPWPEDITRPPVGARVRANVLTRRRIEDKGVNLCSLSSLSVEP